MNGLVIFVITVLWVNPLQNHVLFSHVLVFQQKSTQQNPQVLLCFTRISSLSTFPSKFCVFRSNQPLKKHEWMPNLAVSMLGRLKIPGSIALFGDNGSMDGYGHFSDLWVFSVGYPPGNELELEWEKTNKQPVVFKDMQCALPES